MSAPTATRVLILGGWSPGPLDFLRHQFADRCVFSEPTLHMPPVGLRWCLTWEFALLAVMPWAVMQAWHGLNSQPSKIYWLALLVLCCATIPFLVALLVRGAIRRSVATAERAMQQGIDVVVGFSWGGGIACWLLQRKLCGGPKRCPRYSRAHGPAESNRAGSSQGDPQLRASRRRGRTRLRAAS